jgi:predicted membrane protein (TIGR00267 family)
MQLLKRVVAGSLREIIFGMEDGLVSTLGVVTGIASGTENSKVVILSGVILVLVEALSMAAGTYLSNKAEVDQEALENFHDGHIHPILGALVMGITYIFGGAVPLAPYLFIPISSALPISMVSTVVVLFGVGYFKGKATKTPPIRAGLEMITVSLSAALLGYLIGLFGSKYVGTVK